MLTPARCPARAPARASLCASRRHARRARRAWTTTAEAASPAASSAPEPIRAPPGSRVYFAYGSNVNTKTMNGTRGITPSAAYPAVLPGYELVFNVPGLPFVEPAFASVRRVVGKTDDAPSKGRFARFATETHGVAYVVTDEQWRTILRTETSYVREDVTLERFFPASSGSVDGDAPGRRSEGDTNDPPAPQRIFAMTLVFADADVGGVALLPSARYLGLLREGADEWDLDLGWREYLRTAVQAYDPEISVTRTIGAAVATASFAPLAALAAPASAAAAARGAFEKLLETSGTPGTSGTSASSSPEGGGKTTRVGGDDSVAEQMAEAAFAAGFRSFAETTWGVHNAFWAPAFGSGANNERESEA